jgi:cell division protein FtsW (lipid II flippase)
MVERMLFTPLSAVLVLLVAELGTGALRWVHMAGIKNFQAQIRADVNTSLDS